MSGSHSAGSLCTNYLQNHLLMFLLIAMQWRWLSACCPNCAQCTLPCTCASHSAGQPKPRVTVSFRSEWRNNFCSRRRNAVCNRRRQRRWVDTNPKERRWGGLCPYVICWSLFGQKCQRCYDLYLILLLLFAFTEIYNPETALCCRWSLLKVCTMPQGALFCTWTNMACCTAKCACFCWSEKGSVVDCKPGGGTQPSLDSACPGVAAIAHPAQCRKHKPVWNNVGSQTSRWHLRHIHRSAVCPSGMLCRKHLDCDFVSLFDGFSEPNVFCGAFRLKLGCHLVSVFGRRRRDLDKTRLRRTLWSLINQ